MNVLSISSYLHNASAALISNGTLLCAVEEERLNREKYTNSFPYHSIKYCIEKSGITFRDIDAIALGWNPYLEITQSLKHFVRFFPNTLNVFRDNSTDAPIISRLKKMILLKNEFKKHFDIDDSIKIHYVEHHLAHAANAYFESGFDKATVLVMDGLGDNYDSVSIWKVDKNKFRKVQNIKFPHSVGILYYCIQAYLGFPDNSGAGKIMGLASYGDKSYENFFDSLVEFRDNGKFQLDLSMLNYHIYGNNRPYSKKFVRRYGPSRNIYDPIENKHENMAYALQKLTEKIVLHICQYIHDELNEINLCISGGVGLNCALNGTIAEKKLFKTIYVSNAPHDAGKSIGAGYYISALHQPNITEKINNTAYIGPEYSDDAILRVLSSNPSDNRYKFKKVENPYILAAKKISQGDIVGWFQGRLEFGPRALGNRSILADPREANMKEWLNNKIKFREGFRPFAPSVMSEYVSDYFSLDISSPYMSFICNVNSDKREVIPAVTHVDGTARVQTVNYKQNPLFYSLIEEFYRITGIPIVLNTSLNIKGMPICAAPKDALDCLLLSGMDCLIIGNYYVYKTTN